MSSPARYCDKCGARSTPFLPRIRVGDQMWCAMCAQNHGRTAVAANELHPDIAEQRRKYGVSHTSNGRFLRVEHTGASYADQESRLANQAGWTHHSTFEPVRNVIEGARAYNAKVGLADPHRHSYDHVRQDADTTRTVGRLYDNLPDRDKAALPHFEAMAHEVGQQYHHLTHTMGIHVESTHEDPYKNVHEMVRDVADNKRLKVLSTAATGGHPFFSDEQNDRFRAVHDAFGHAATGRDFDRHGEQAAYLAHSQMFSPHARPAMASETKAQNCSLILNGHFGPQKVALLPRHHWDDSSLRGVDPRHASLRGFGGVGSEPWPGLPDLSPNASGRSSTYEDPMNAGHGSAPATRRATATSSSPWGTVGDATARPQHSPGNSPTDARHLQGTRSTTSAATTHPAATRRTPVRNFPSSTTDDDSGRSRSASAGTPTPNTSSGSSTRRTATPTGTARNAVARTVQQPTSGSVNDGARGRSLPDSRLAVVVRAGKLTRVGALQVLAHDSGDGETIFHCPFCGSGQVIARNDGSVDCSFCQTAFTVQVQPQMPAFPQTIDGMPVQVPGMPNGGADANVPAGADPGADPMAPDDGSAPPDGPPGADDGSAPPDDDSDDSGSDSAPPWAKKSYRTAAGVVLDERHYRQHIALATTNDRSRTLARIRAENRSPR